MPVAILFLAAHTICVIVHTGVMALVGSRLSATVEEASIFFRPTPIRLRFCRTQDRVGIIPSGGSVRFLGDRDGPAAPEEGFFAATPTLPGFGDLHPLVWAATPAAGCLALIALGAFCLDPSASIRSLGRGFLQIIPFAPWVPAWVPAGEELADRLFSLLQNKPFALALGVIAVREAAFNLLPVPPLNGSDIGSALAHGRKRPSEWGIRATTVGIMISVGLMGYWALQLVGAWWRQL